MRPFIVLPLLESFACAGGSASQEVYEAAYIRGPDQDVPAEPASVM